MSPLFITYVVYLVITIALTVWVGKTLHRNGRIFLVDVFDGNEALADSVNHLLVVGFYLVNLGYVTLALKLRGEIPALRNGIEALSGKVGGVLLVLGLMPFFNLFAFGTPLLFVGLWWLGTRFRREILERGSSRSAMDSYVAFRGRAPELEVDSR